jgi:hypothetical protein
MVIVPGTIERQLLLHSGQAVWDDVQAARTLVLERPDAALDHREAAVLADGAEALPDATTPAPTSECPGDERRPWSVTRPRGWSPLIWMSRFRKPRMAMAVGWRRKIAKPMTRREQWSMATLAHQQKGQVWGRANGTHEVKKPSDVGTVVRSTCQRSLACGR